jgi:hypothetical protein
MKRPARILGNLLAMALAVFSLQVMAAETQTAGRSFDHATTGFPLVGGHAIAACETCHVGGVFKGTPRNCDGCHTVGSRVVATPKSTSHVVTDAPCDSCHFNTSTFLGARYNHGAAVPGQCMVCHNGRITAGRPANHNAGFMATGSCDNCHRTYAFLPASWNHTGVAMGGRTCNQAGCHLAGANNANRYTAVTATSPVNHSSYTDTSSQSCDVCHISFVSWNATMHEPYGGRCDSCHGAGRAQGTPTTGHVAVGTDDCSACHTSTVTWLGALGAKPANHIPYNAGVGCGSCHLGTGVATGATLHAYVSPPCKTCHDSNSPAYLGVTGKKRLGSHEGSTTSQDCITCHRVQYTSWNKP